LALLERGATPDNVTTWGTTALHYAVQHDEIDLARALLDAGAPLDARDSENDATPLGWVGRFGGLGEMGDLLREYEER
jgi:ankyrin repeat protein